jgi:hypothetical protein
MGTERERVDGFGRLEEGLRQASDWYLWGPYVSERQWGTVREDYSADGDAWRYLPHDHPRSRAYRWGEDGLAGFCDVEQRLCLGLALWNGRDDRLLTPDRTAVPVKTRSMVSIIPVLTAAVVDEPLIAKSLTLGKNFAEFLDRRGLGDPDRLRKLGLPAFCARCGHDRR